MSNHAEDDVAALRQELASVRARQEILADALAATGDEIMRLKELEDTVREIRHHAEAALRHLDIDYEQGSRIDRGVQSIEAILELLP